MTTSNPEPYLVIAGTETDLHYNTKFPLRYEAAFETLFSPEWEAHVEARHKAFCDIAIKYNRPIVIGAMTWRASRVWYDKMGISYEERNKIPGLCVKFANKMAEYVNMKSTGGAHAVVIGFLGPMSDAYVHDSKASFEKSKEYHQETVKSLKDAGLDSIIAGSMNGSAEASAITAVAAEQGIECCVFFTLGSDGKLPSGETLKDAIEKVDSVTPPESFGISCVHPKHIKPLLVEAKQNGEKWVERLRGIMANSSSKEHEELDNADELDEGDPKQLAKELKELKEISPCIKTLGGCCGTGPNHCEELAKLLIN